MAKSVKTVSQITRELKEVVETNFPKVWVVGEISNCSRASSGHIYFTMKDDSSQLRAVLWRSAAARLRFDIHDGLEVVAAGPIEVYHARGTYQLIVQQLQPQGIGALELAFRQLQQKLAAEGLFDPQHKKPLPQFARRIALITSPTGAAVQDMLQVINRRWRVADIIILPVAVQGDSAAHQIASAIQAVVKMPRVDVVIVGRGGGSLEDLWAFNEEIVARAIYDCPIPIVSAVGHEIDVSISDLVADRRALTPSEAAELVVPHRAEILEELRGLQLRLTSALKERAVRARVQLDAIATRRVITNPLERIHDLTSRLDELDLRSRNAIHRRIESKQLQLQSIAAALQALSPLGVLQRGYSLSYRLPRSAAEEQTPRLIRKADELQLGDRIETRFVTGRVISNVESIDANIAPYEPKKSQDDS